VELSQSLFDSKLVDFLKNIRQKAAAKRELKNKEMKNMTP
jgi:hypothetical protein